MPKLSYYKKTMTTICIEITCCSIVALIRLFIILLLLSVFVLIKILQPVAPRFFALVETVIYCEELAGTTLTLEQSDGESLQQN